MLYGNVVQLYRIFNLSSCRILLYWFVFKPLRWQNLFVVIASYVFTVGGTGVSCYSLP